MVADKLPLGVVEGARKSTLLASIGSSDEFVGAHALGHTPPQSTPVSNQSRNLFEHDGQFWHRNTP
jgi:hypothetical protein